MMHGKSLDFELMCCCPFGDHVQTHEENEPTNNVKDGSLGAMCLGPLDDSRGGHKFVNLKTGKMTERRQWTSIHMTQEVMDRVVHIGERQKGPKCAEFRTRQGHLEGDLNLTADDGIT